MPLRRSFVPALALFALCALGCGNKSSSLSVPLKFRPTSQLNMSGFAGDLPDTKVHVGPVNDVRDNKDQIGENVEESTPKPIYVGGGAEPGQWVQQYMGELLTKAGLQVTDNRGEADRVLLTDLHHFWTRETNTYESEIRATIIVQEKGGRQLWKGTINGTAERFGKSLSAENYQEVYSDALVNMMQNLLNNPGFRNSLKRDAKPGPGTPGAGTSASGR